MQPPIARIVAASAAVKAKLGTNPVRFWSFGEAPRNQEGVPAGGTPYAVWQTVYGTPENMLACTPGSDLWGTQVDVYAKAPKEAREVAEVLRDAFEPEAYVVSWNGEFVDEETRLYRYSFTVEWQTDRT